MKAEQDRISVAPSTELTCFILGYRLDPHQPEPARLC